MRLFYKRHLEVVLRLNPRRSLKLLKMKVRLMLYRKSCCNSRLSHRQEEEIDYDEVIAPVARIGAIRIFLAFASYMGLIVYKMDVKSAFLYGKIDEKVYVSQPPVFIDPKFLNKKSWCDEFEALMKRKFQMSYIGELTFFLGLQTQKPLTKDEETADVDVHLYRSMIGSLMYLTTSRPDIMYAVCACFRFQVTPKTSHLQSMKRIFRKSTKRGCQFLGRKLISWQCKKQTIMAASTTKAEYVATASYLRLSIKKRFGKKESVSKHGRKKDKPKPTLDDSTFDGLDVDLDANHGMDYMDTKEPVNEGRLSGETKVLNLTTDTGEIAQDKENGEKGGSTKELVSIARPEDSTVWLDVGTDDPIAPPTTTNIEDSSRPARSVLTLKPLPTIDPKDKGKGVLKEPEPAKKMTRSDLDAAQFAKDAELARLVYEEELAELEREKEKRQREEEASKAAIAEMYDEVQAEIKFDDMGGYKHSQLKANTFAEIQGLYERQKRMIDDFKPMDSDDAVDKAKVLEEPNSTNVEVKQEGDEESIKKRQG
nr:hypothetical protein [Tanacetum cinerariifolium]